MLSSRWPAIADRKGILMKKMIRTMSVVFGVVLVATFFALNTNAPCGASDGQVTTAAATSLLERSAPLRNASQTRAQPAVSQQRKTEEVSIVGFWHVKFVSEGTTGIPDGTIIDMVFSQWHSDGTEILNSSRPPPPAIAASACGRRRETTPIN
jgi:hypothetical protein